MVKPFTFHDGEPYSGFGYDFRPRKRTTPPPPPPPTGLSDDFTGTAGTINGRVPTVGTAWVLGTGAVNLNGSGSIVGASTTNIASSDAGKTDGVVTITATTDATGAWGLVYRFLDVNNHWRVQVVSTFINIIEMVAGTPTSRAAGNGFQTTGTIILTLSGNDMTVTGTLVNGAPITHSSAAGTGRTKFGVYIHVAGPSISSIDMP